MLDTSWGPDNKTESHWESIKESENSCEDHRMNAKWIASRISDLSRQQESNQGPVLFNFFCCLKCEQIVSEIFEERMENEEGERNKTEREGRGWIHFRDGSTD